MASLLDDEVQTDSGLQPQLLGGFKLLPLFYLPSGEPVAVRLTVKRHTLNSHLSDTGYVTCLRTWRHVIYAGSSTGLLCSYDTGMGPLQRCRVT